MATLVAPVLGSPPLRRQSPPSIFRGVTPAAGASFVQAVDDSLVWRVLSIIVTLTTDANAANRDVRIEYRDEADNIFCIDGNPVQITASDTQTISYSVWHQIGDWTSGVAWQTANLSGPFLWPGFDFKIAVTNVQATDALTAIRFVVEKFYQPSGSDYPAFG